MTNGTSPPPTPAGVTPTVAAPTGAPPAAGAAPRVTPQAAPGRRVSFETAKANAAKVAGRFKGEVGIVHKYAAELSLAIVAAAVVSSGALWIGYWGTFRAVLPFAMSGWAAQRDLKIDGKISWFTLLLLGFTLWLPIAGRVNPILIEAVGGAVSEVQQQMEDN